jgi:hypothetical protein
MQFRSLALFGALVAANIAIDFDQALEGRVGLAMAVEEVVGHTYARPQFRQARGSSQERAVAETSFLLGRGGGLGALLGKRQYCVDPGYGPCPNIDRCCPENQFCCHFGYCIESQEHKCCPGGSCEPDHGCCGNEHCYPLGGDCCSDESFCYPGNSCYIYPDEDGPVCCTDSECTAHVDEFGTTSYATTSTSTRTYTTTSTQYYYWTVTWYYYYYYWTYSVEIEASIVTSSERTTSTTFSVETTDAAAASSYFEDLSESLDLPTPASATSLASIAGSTSFLDEPTETFSSSSTTEFNTSTTASESTTGSGTSSDDNSGSGDGGGESAAHALWSQLDVSVTGFLTVGVAFGMIAALL